MARLVVQLEPEEAGAQMPRRELESALAETLNALLGVPADKVEIAFDTPPPRRDAPSGPSATVLAYLEAMEARDEQTASRLRAADFVMVFPGGVRFRTLAELRAWAGRRYRCVAKTIDHVWEAADGDRTVVCCHGTLHGEWPDGRRLSGIRFIDRFVVAGGRLGRQDVWNDLAEFAPRAR